MPLHRGDSGIPKNVLDGTEGIVYGGSGMTLEELITLLTLLGAVLAGLIIQIKEKSNDR